MDSKPFEAMAADLEIMRQEVAKVIVGQGDLLALACACLVADGHLLVEGVPGLAKTRTVRCLASAVGGQWQRLQFTPDLLPSDVIGTRVWRPREAAFAFEPGPVFANFVLADEVNRAPAKVQSALLEAMEERQVTVALQTMALPRPFLVIATQNPLDLDGTYALPEAQTDRFLASTVLQYPSAAEELEVVRRDLAPVRQVRTVLPLDRLLAGQHLREQVHVPAQVAAAAVSLAHATRQLPEVALGAGPRGTLAMVRIAQAFALCDGRPIARLADLARAALPALRHRVQLTRAASLDGRTPEGILDSLVASTMHLEVTT